MNTTPHARQGKEITLNSIRRRIELCWEKLQEGVHSTWRSITIRGRRAQKEDERQGHIDYESKPEHIVLFVEAEPSRITEPSSATKFDINWPAELHVLGPRRNMWVRLWHNVMSLAVVLLILFFGIWVWQHYIVPHEYLRERIELDPANSPVLLILAYPKYIAGGEQGYVDVTICNEADRPISSVVVVDFSDEHHIVCMNCSETNEAEFEGLAPRVRQTWRITFVLNEAPYYYTFGSAPPPSVRFDVRVVDRHGNWVDAFSDKAIDLAPVPYLHTLLASGGVFSTFYVALLILPVELLKKSRS